MSVLLSLILLVAAISSSAFDFPLKFGLCKNPQFQGEFKISKFFNKTWYVRKIEGDVFSRKFSCMGVDTKIVGNDIRILNFQYEPLLHRFITTRGDTDARFVQYEGLYFPVTYSFGGHNISIAFSIIGTDYGNWAAVYFCKQYFAFKAELSWLLVADRTARPRADPNGLSTVGLRLGDYRCQGGSACGDHPHL